MSTTLSFDASGGHRWSTRLRTSTFSSPTNDLRVAQAADGAPLLAGQSDGDADLGLGPLDPGEGFAATFDAAGNTLWAQPFEQVPSLMAGVPPDRAAVARYEPVASPNYDRLHLDLLAADGTTIQTIGGQAAGSSARIAAAVASADYLYFCGYSDGVVKLSDFGDFVGTNNGDTGFIAQYQRN